MSKSVALGLLLTGLLAGCSGKTAPASFRPPDLTKVDRVVVGHAPSHASKELRGAEASRLVQLLTDAPAVPAGAASPTCYDPLDLKLYAGAALVETAQTGPGACLILLASETAPRQPGAEAKQLFQSLFDTLADPYMAQFIPYRQALEAARATQADSPWRLLFLPEVAHELSGVKEKIPTWVAIAIGPMGNRDKLFIDARKDRATRIFLVTHLDAEQLHLPPMDGKPPLTAQEALALVCTSVDCIRLEPVDIEFRAHVPLPMANDDRTFPAWAITFADKTTHRMDMIGLFNAYTGGLATEEGPPK